MPGDVTQRRGRPRMGVTAAGSGLPLGGPLLGRGREHAQSSRCFTRQCAQNCSVTVAPCTCLTQSGRACSVLANV